MKYFRVAILFICVTLKSQIFYVSNGTDLYISANTTFSADNLTLVPSASFTLSNLSLSKNSTISNSADPTAVSRFYKFSATTNAYSGTIQVNYLDAELNSLSESSLQVNVHNGTSWSAITSSTNDASNNYVLSNSVSSKTLNEIALAGSANPLPVELKNFTANQRNGIIYLNWITATENANFGFDIERRSQINNIYDSWMKIGFVKGSGTTTSEKNYSFVDASVRKGKYNYRLKQIDRDGKFSYHNSEEIVIGLVSNKIVLDDNYPNPFNNETVINFQIPKSEFVNLIIYDLSGKEIKTLINENLNKGFYSIKFNSSGINSGVYYYKLSTKNDFVIKKLVLVK